ncbi:hypothetical protein [Conexibacter sp. DBS9H8]|uniref:hypothetical protein n=1 Tax=Conexibacter sp. DBS9H8 TaxID=2937801 RepID=UPI00200C5FEF|nr:hypothetical protein [Conexibacter sp. DBS9H8]
MAKQQQRQVRIEPKNQLAQMQALETKSDEELAAETRFRALAQAILGSRAAERYDADAARMHFQKALAAARPQERLQLRRMADASLALAERRPDDLKAAAERLGVEAPTRRQLFGLRVFGLIAPPKSAGAAARYRGVAIGILLFILFLAAIWGIPYLIITGIAAITGQISMADRTFYGIAAAVLIVVGLVLWARRRNRAAQAKRSEMLAQRRGGR